MIFVLNWILLGWLFWPIVAIALFAPHIVLKYVKDFTSVPAFLLAIGGGALWWRWPFLFPHTWVGAAWVAGLYLLAGGLYCAFKYVGLLRRFRQSVTTILSDCRNLPLVDQTQRLNNDLPYDYRNGYEIKDGMARLIWNRWPLSNWWAWWPWFLCGSALDFISNLGERLVEAFKGFWQWLTNLFAVKL